MTESSKRFENVRRKPRVPVDIAALNKQIVDTTASMCVTYSGAIVLPPKEIEVAKALEISVGQLYLGGDHHKKFQTAMGLEGFHVGTVLVAECATRPADLAPPLQEPTQTAATIDTLAAGMPNQELAQTVARLLVELDSR